MTGAPAGREWGALELEIPEHVEELLLGHLEGRTAGAQSVPVAPGVERLTAFFETPDQASRAVPGVRRLLRSSGLAADAYRVRALRVTDGRWVERYQASLRAFELGTRFRVDPSGRASGGGAGRIGVSLVPGRAFGTGEHATTRLCVEALEEVVRARSAWVDLGCGSGILAVVAAHCGASSVLALDNDPLAIEVAAEVVARNGLAAAIRLRRGSWEAAPPGIWDGVVANISRSVLLEGAARTASLLRPRGTLVASGFLATDTDLLADAFAKRGLSESGRRAEDEWGLLTCEARER